MLKTSFHLFVWNEQLISKKLIKTKRINRLIHSNTERGSNIWSIFILTLQFQKRILCKTFPSFAILQWFFHQTTLLRLRASSMPTLLFHPCTFQKSFSRIWILNRCLFVFLISKRLRWTRVTAYPPLTFDGQHSTNFHRWFYHIQNV